MAVDQVGTFEQDNLVSGPHGENETNATPVTMKTGAAYVRGSLIIALAADTGDYTLADTAATPTVAEKLTIKVLTEDVDATGGAVEVNAWQTGKYNSAAMTFGGTDTGATWKEDARNVGIIFTEQATNNGVS